MALVWDDTTMSWVDSEDPIDPYKGWSDPVGSGVEIPDLPPDFDDKYPEPDIPHYDPGTGRLISTPKPGAGSTRPPTVAQLNASLARAKLNQWPRSELLPTGGDAKPEKPPLADRLRDMDGWREKYEAELANYYNARGHLQAGAALQDLLIEPLAGTTERRVLNAIKVAADEGGWTIDELVEQMKDPTFAQSIADGWGIDVGLVQSLTGKMLATGISGILMMLTGNFPLAAMGYFAADRALEPDRSKFTGFPGLGQWRGTPILPIGISIPQGLPNEIFNDFRFICFDRMGQKWYPTNEVRPLNYQSDVYRYFCLDRLDGKVYHANFIKKPEIYI